MAEFLTNPRHMAQGTRQNDMKLGQLDIRMQKLEKSNQALRERIEVLEAKRGPGRPPKAEAA
jgi:hypothetical protein